jgi:hypothetical protein
MIDIVAFFAVMALFVAAAVVVAWRDDRDRRAFWRRGR